MLAVAFLAGCGGGGGGGGGLSSTLAPLSRTVVPYTGGELAAPNTVYTATTRQQSFSYDYVAQTSVTNLQADPANSGRIDLGLNARAELDYVRIESASQSTDFSLYTGSGDVLTPVIDPPVAIYVFSDASGDKTVLLATTSDFDYQGFGWWLNDNTPSTGVGAAFTTGSITTPAGLQLSGSAEYLGISAGLYVDAAGAPFFVSSVIDATANFEASSLTYSSTNTAGANFYTGVRLADPERLNFVTVNTINRANSSFSGSVTPSLTWTEGTSSGSFYGPQNQEIGGIFSMTGPIGSYVGSFGAAR